MIGCSISGKQKSRIDAEVVDNKNNKKKFSEIIFHGKKFSEL
jgi:hypothetical protein